MIQRDQKLIADIIAENSKFAAEEIEKMFLAAETKTPEEAKVKCLINDVKDAVIPAGAETIQFVFQR